MLSKEATDIDPPLLSQNWKKLQVKLKTGNTGSTKRKSDFSPQSNPSKRQRVLQDYKPRNSHLEEKDKRCKDSDWRGTVDSVPSASLALWAEDNDISARDLAAAYGTSLKSASLPDVRKNSEDINGGLSMTAEAGRYVAIDCEMVGVGPTPNKESALARVSLINYHGEQLYDSFVKTKEQVTDYRTAVSGITRQLLRTARSFEAVQKDVAKLLEGKILIGHAISNDLDALLLGHPRRDIRDTSKHAPFRLITGGRPPGLKRLAREVLGVDIQRGEHSSIEDARATMLLFRRDKEAFEREHLAKWGPDRRAQNSTKDSNDQINKRNPKRRKRKHKK